MVGAVSSLVCPECGCTRLFKAGLRYLASGETVQRYLCRECGYRFSEPSHDARGENLKAFSAFVVI